MTAKETFIKKWVDYFGSEGDEENEQLKIALEHDYIFQAMQDYARQKCEEQRNICSEKGIVFTDADGDQAVITGGDFILNAPEPNFD